MNKIYAVKVPFEDGELFVTEGTGSDLIPVLFTKKDEAGTFAKTWGEFARVVEYCDLDDELKEEN